MVIILLSTILHLLYKILIVKLKSIQFRILTTLKHQNRKNYPSHLYTLFYDNFRILFTLFLLNDTIDLGTF